MSRQSSCSAPGAFILAAAIGSIAAPTQASQVIQQFQQAEQRAPSGQLLVEESTINVVACNGAGENGGQYYIYQYHKRPGFRAISPPNWAQAIGGRDWPTLGEAASAACGSGGAPQPTIPTSNVNVSGQWSLATNCGWTNPPWQATIVLNEAADGSLTASTANDPLRATLVPPGGSVRGAQFSLTLQPDGWESVLQFTGTATDSVIQGQIHHYTHDDCAFTMSRLA
jgi:hypothetical protein